MKKKILILAALVLMLACTFSLGALTVSAEEAKPTVSIEKFNLDFEDNTYLKYAVKFTDIDDVEINKNNVGMLYWTDFAEGFVPGTEDYSSETTGYTTIDGVKHYVFEYTHLAAKQLTDYIYSVAFLEYNGETYYSEPVKYSALEYAYNRLGKTSEGTTDEELKALLNDMLAYGASAQQYFDYKEDRLATADFYQITLVGGMLDDGFASGLYLSSDKVTITASETDDNLIFAGWQNSAKEIVSTEKIALLENFNSNATFVAKYSHKGLAFYSSGNGTCYVSGIGTCSDVDVIIPEMSPAGDKVTGIGANAFKNASNIESVVIPESVTYIGDNAFYSCSKLADVIISNGVISIGDNAFDCCNSLTNVTIPNSVTSIGDNAFYRCSSLTKVTIPNSVTSIGDRAFCWCTNIKNIEIPDGVKSIGEFAFYWCTSLVDIKVGDNNLNYKSVNGDLYSKDCKTFIQYALGKTDNSFIVPNYVTNICEGAFSYAHNLETVAIPESVTEISDTAFYECSGLTSVTIGYGVTSIGRSAFENCGNLTSVAIPDSVTTIGANAFNDCYNLKSVRISNNVKSIEGGAFSYCKSLSSIVIPESVTSIGYYAFRGCTSITSINFGGTKAQWNAITKDYDWDLNTGDYTVYCTDAEIKKG